MRTFLNARHLTIALTGAIGLGLSGVAYAVNPFTYSTPQTGYVSIPSAAFTPHDPNAAYSNNGAVISGTADGTCFAAPVNLPQGAKLSQIAIWYAKDSAVPTNVTFFRMTLAHPGTVVIAQVTATNTGNVFKSKTANVTDTSLQTVNNRSFAYFIDSCLSSNETFASARVTYTYRTAGD